MVWLVCDNTNLDAYFCAELVKKFYLGIDAMTINQDLYQFLVYLDHGAS